MSESCEPKARLVPFADRHTGETLYRIVTEDTERDLLLGLIETDCKELNADELAVVRWMTKRMVQGRTNYAPLDVENDTRDFEKEKAEEQIDSLNYAGMLFVKRVLKRRRDLVMP